MRTMALITLAVMALGGPAHAEENPFAENTALAGEELEAKRGGTEIPGVAQVAETTQSAGNSGNSITVANGGVLNTGTIYGSTITGNSGITAVMQNTGNLVNMNNATSINVYTR